MLFLKKLPICLITITSLIQISKKKKKFVYESRSSVQLEGAELALYEEVARTPPFLRRVLALVGTRGVGRRTLKNRMIQEHPDRFGAVVPRECSLYHFEVVCKQISRSRRGIKLKLISNVQVGIK